MKITLLNLLETAVAAKPIFGDKCNNCGYCCLSEVCRVGVALTGKSIGPCELLTTEGDKHYCSLVVKDALMGDIIGAGEGCCAETQAEAIQRITQQ